jgi:hypothetical protein
MLKMVSAKFRFILLREIWAGRLAEPHVKNRIEHNVASVAGFFRRRIFNFITAGHGSRGRQNATGTPFQSGDGLTLVRTRVRVGDTNKHEDGKCGK